MVLTKLAAFGITEDGTLVVANVRKTKPGRVGYYSHMSQFRSRARIVVDVAAIQAELPPYLVVDEVLKTIAHEYGHIIAEAIREIPRLSNGADRIAVPDWTAQFPDEEDFAEDLARFLVSYDSQKEHFWEPFLRAYGAECARLYAE